MNPWYDAEVGKYIGVAEVLSAELNVNDLAL